MMIIPKHYSPSLTHPLTRDPKDHSRNQSFFVNHLLQTELFALPLQQSALKNEVRRQISHESLSLKAFKAIFPLASQMFAPKEEKRFIFELIRQIAEHPQEEFGGRCLWVQTYGDFNKAQKDLRLKGWDGKTPLYVEDSRCGTTFDVLKATFFGLPKTEYRNGVLHIITNVKVELIDTPLGSLTLKKAIAHFKKAWANIERNAIALKTTNSPAIYTYGFGLQGNRNFLGHGYWVIQYLDESSTIKYRIFQSFLSECNLKGFLDQKQKPLSHKKFMLFCEGIQKCLLADLWTEELETIFIHNFGTASGLKIGDKNFSRDSFSMISGKRTWTDVVEQFQKFEDFSSQQGFPKIQTYQQKKTHIPLTPFANLNSCPHPSAL